MTTPPSNSKVEELVRRLHAEPHGCTRTMMGRRCRKLECYGANKIRSAVLAALELAAETVGDDLKAACVCTSSATGCLPCQALFKVRSLSIPPEKPREEP